MITKIKINKFSEIYFNDFENILKDFVRIFLNKYLF